MQRRLDSIADHPNSIPDSIFQYLQHCLSSHPLLFFSCTLRLIRSCASPILLPLSSPFSSFSLLSHFHLYPSPSVLLSSYPPLPLFSCPLLLFFFYSRLLLSSSLPILDVSFYPLLLFTSTSVLLSFCLPLPYPSPLLFSSPPLHLSPCSPLSLPSTPLLLSYSYIFLSSSPLLLFSCTPHLFRLSMHEPKLLVRGLGFWDGSGLWLGSGQLLLSGDG